MGEQCICPFSLFTNVISNSSLLLSKVSDLLFLINRHAPEVPNVTFIRLSEIMRNPSGVILKKTRLGNLCYLVYYKFKNKCF